MQNPHASAVTFSVTCGIVPSQHVRLVSKANGHWDYTGGKVLVMEEPTGADLPVWRCTIELTQKTTFKYRYVVSDGTSFVNLSSILAITPKGPAMKRVDGNFGPLFGITFPTPGQSQQWLHSHTQLFITVGYPDSYQSCPQHPRLGLQIHEPTGSYTFVSSIWSGKTKLMESSHDQFSSASFQIPNLSSVTSVNLIVQSSGVPLGRVHILPSQLDAGHGLITSPIVDATLEVIGSLTFHYSIITPFTHATLQLCTRKSFPAKPTLVGHRGSGAEGSRTQIAGSPRSHIKENTLLSFEKAGALGAHFIEFDAHLTSDMVPVIYHDFSVHHSGISTPIHALTLEEFKKIGSKSIEKSKSFSNLHPFLSSSSPSKSSSPSEPLAGPIFDNFPTLKQTLQQVPNTIGFNIEVKYPMQDELDLHNLRPVDRNAYVDCILWDVFEFAKDREIVFSSFDPDICVLLSMKQPKYPVFFLTEMGTLMRSDPRCNSPEASIHFAKAHQLQGLVCPATFLLKSPAVVEQIKKAELMVATWGRDNNHPDNVDKQLSMGVNGIIVDHVAHIAKHWLKSVN